MTLETVRAAYGARSGEYTRLLGAVTDMAEADRELIARWAGSTEGALLDVGCGPGHWTDHLRGLGSEVTGIDPVPEFVAGARARFPLTDYRLGRAERLPGEPGSVGGILAWYSLIHTDPDAIDAPLREFARVLRPGGSLLMGFFRGEAVAPFDHAVTTAYSWPVATLSRRLESAGFRVVGSESRHDPGSRPHASIIATR